MVPRNKKTYERRVCTQWLRTEIRILEKKNQSHWWFHWSQDVMVDCLGCATGFFYHIYGKNKIHGYPLNLSDLGPYTLKLQIWLPKLNFGCHLGPYSFKMQIWPTKLGFMCHVGLCTLKMQCHLTNKVWYDKILCFQAYNYFYCLIF